jgi:hypothetical protein
MTERCKQPKVLDIFIAIITIFFITIAMIVDISITGLLYFWSEHY